MLRTATVCLIVSTLLVGCGGGGGSKSSAPVTMPDIEVIGALAPEIIAVGGTTEVVFQITNLGDASFTAAVFFIELTDVDLNTLDTVTVTLPALAPGEVTFVQEFIQSTAGDAGKTFHVFGWVNIDGTVPEPNLDNNIDVATFQVAAAV